jgi:hypothetical protein
LAGVDSGFRSLFLLLFSRTILNMLRQFKEEAKMSRVNGSFIGTHALPQNLSISQLRADVKGRVIAPEDADYDAVRIGLSRDAVRRPALIVRPVDAFDVSQVVSLARETGMELAIRSGGHSLAGFSTSEGGIVLDLS